ncbi:SDR family oxidoreductase [bacterium BMS3Abin03]|nr:SDR family oxidoreductase [bacterium BMS3Abin03]MCG6960686.1 SDR family oxidoreductase [bacterium BMS3Abin03]
MILVTGATGYVGGRLVPRLLEKKYKVRCLVRDVSRLESRWKGVELVESDVLNADSLEGVFKDIDVAYYLIHSMGGDSEFSETDIIAAKNFAQAAENQGVKRIIYLGGLGSSEENLSKHLSSRLQTGDTLRKFNVPVTEFRAGVIVGSGSLSFEMIRYLTERLAIMITPKWVNTKTQPIAIRDVLRYLVEALTIEKSSGEIIDIGGEDILTYRDLMRIYAEIRGLKRYFIKVPVLTPRLSSHWIGFVTPLPSRIAKPLVDGLKTELICKSNKAKDLFGFKTISYKEAVKLALLRKKEGTTKTIWFSSYSAGQQNKITPVHLVQKEGMMIEKRELIVNASVESTFKTFTSLGGKNGWYANFLWKMRGYIDLLAGGVGLRRGRRSENELITGDPLDFWRVEAIEKNKLLRLRAEMKVPGKAWLQFQAEETNNNKSTLTQTAFYEPKGLLGLLYWYALYPLHGLIFRGMIRSIKTKAEDTGI